MKTLLAILLIGLCAAQVQAAIKTETVEYRDGEAVLEGFLAYDNAIRGKRPGVIVVHEWMGLEDYAKKRAVQLAELGYLAFAVDMYGKGVRAKDHKEAGELAGYYKSDRQRMRARIGAGLNELRKHPLADPQHVAAIGYCFGGTSVLELARSGADIAGVVSFHGALGTPNPEDARNIKAKVLVFHGASDPSISAEEVKAFQEEMTRGNVDWQMVFYGGAVHSFTNPEAGHDPSQGKAYDAKADQRSWEGMKLFFRELFGPPKP